ncbi:DUF1433 domain-containing protein [Bacillus safensis]|uniref:DUF1433 domain-containing protein n=1 Tax=Bacillus safensis TaxID=561879 RepID=UPI000F04A29A|nr:DUF1433 domain-containing protein [Bacillus safensis]MBI1627947.1 DUF1433 domain-containing protein [Bacillus safensis]MBS4742656.1 DUF1433 domain-containing protein [Bacillus safensis]MED4592202.1 DUF1433 domain-containing protein [Bacillus safensis]MED4636770.1 DUF1433 domain-containing protein [Bacillus safensis]NRF05033.1 DUF1433 domain-containing protein [Bacillus safensis]
MRNTLKFSIIIVVAVISVTVFVVEYIHQSFSDEVVQEKSDQEKAEEFAEKMKPKIEERLHKKDIHHFIEKITFKKKVVISPMGYVTVDGYINDDADKFYFSASLIHKSNEIGSMSYSPELSYRFKDWDKYKDEPEIKENYLNRLSEKERKQYLKDIGEKE